MLLITRLVYQHIFCCGVLSWIDEGPVYCILAFQPASVGIQYTFGFILRVDNIYIRWYKIWDFAIGRWRCGKGGAYEVYSYSAVVVWCCWILWKV